MSDCIFCKIIAGEIPSNKAYEDDDVYAFHDINPNAPKHILFVPKRHIACIADMSSEDQLLIGRVIHAATNVARELHIEHYRLVNNNGEEAGQSVFHVHFHLMGGRRFTWPPG